MSTPLRRTCRWRNAAFLITGLSIALLVFLSTAAVNPVLAQETERDTLADATISDARVVEQPAGNEDRPRVYIDCWRCDYDHIRREVTFVDYVRDRELADVHVFVTDESTGGGGREYEFSFIGRGDYDEINYTLTHTSDRNATRDQTRDNINRLLRMGLAPYVMQNVPTERFDLTYEAPEGGETEQRQVHDPWNYWVFEIYGGRASWTLESNRSDFDARWGFYANRVTEEWRIQMRPYFNFTRVAIDRQVEGDDGEPEIETIISNRHRHGISSYAIRSINDHWSTGVYGNYLTRNDRNIQHRYQMNPGVEYSVFPYAEATRRSITFTYQIGYTWADYYEMTIFEQTQEALLNHQLQASVYYQQPWGSIRAGLTGAHYFHDLDKRRAEFFSRVSVQLTGGLSLSLGANLEMIQDQLQLPAGDADLEEILLDQRELATDFMVSSSISLSYTFGSDFANVVNTRM